MGDRYALVPLADMMPRLAAALAEEKKNPDHKVMVFFVAARVVQVSILTLLAPLVTDALNVT